MNSAKVLGLSLIWCLPGSFNDAHSQDSGPRYRAEQLKGWAHLLREQWGADATTYAYFNNDGRACALRDAVMLAGFARAEGLAPSRVPDPSDIRVSQE